ncbi:MAG TPA: hypothetical protein VHY08_12555 [Bacillota bacterium]|nr:hypothetical protein [Bacillota bacterium]
MPTYAVFSDLRQLVLGIYLCSEKKLPEDVFWIDNSSWAVEISPGLVNQENWVRYFQQLYAYSAPIAASATGDSQLNSNRQPLKQSSPNTEPAYKNSLSSGAKKYPLATIIDQGWLYRDPQRYEPFVSDSKVLGFTPDRKEIQYLIAARTSEKAQILLDLLTGALVTGIKALAFPLEPVDGTMPFKYFWRVESANPPVPALVLQSADQCWWGPISPGLEIFLPYPWSLELDPRLVSLIYPRNDGDFILLNHPEQRRNGSKPQAYRVRRMDGVPEFKSLIEIANLKVSERAAEETDVIPDESSREFDVELKLVEKTAKAQIEDHIKDLKLDIRAKQLLLARLEYKAPESYGSQIETPEPLYLYEHTPGDEIRGTDLLPSQLERLIMEWTDQTGELGNLQYTALEPGVLPESMAGKGSTGHVLTTSRALGKGLANEEVCWRLAEYSHTAEKFYLVQEWLKYDLRIFIPQGKRLQLYPELFPNSVTADKLANALLQETRSERSQWLILLTQKPGESVAFFCLRIANFRPFVDSFEWACKLNTPLPSNYQKKITALMPAVEEYFLDSIKAAMDTAVTDKAKNRFEICQTTLQQQLQNYSAQLDTLLKEIQERADQISDLRARFDDINRESEKLNGKITDFRNLCVDLQKKGASLQKDQAKIQAFLNTLNRQITETHQITNRIAELKQKLAAIPRQPKILAAIIRRIKNRFLRERLKED